jgi:conjugal transfer ATP-binding protein TraC
MTVTTERIRTQKASDIIHLDTYTGDEERLIFAKPDGDKAFVGRVYVASPLVGHGGEFSNVVQNLLKSAPDDSVIQVSLLCTPDHEAADVYARNKEHGPGATTELVQRQRAVLEAATRGGFKSDLPILNCRRSVISVAMPISRIGTEAIEEAQQLHAEFLGNLKGCGFHDAVALTPAQVVDLYREFARMYAKQAPVELDPLLDIRYQVFGPDETFDFRDRRVGVFNAGTPHAAYCAAVTVKAFPKKVSHGLMNLASGAPLNVGPTREGGGQRIPGPFILSTTVRVAHQRKEAERVHNAIESRAEKGGKPRKELPFKLGDEDPSAKLKDLLTLQSQCAEDGNKYVYVSTVGLLFGRTKEEAIDAASKLAGTLDKLEFDARHVEVNGLVRWAQTLPLNFSPKIADQLQCEAVMSAEAAGCLFPVYGDHPGNTGPSSTHTGIGLITRRGSLYGFDPFTTNTNANGVIAADSGSGKTSFVQNMIVNALAEGGHVFGLDNGKTMKKLTKAVGGEFIEFGERGGFRPSLNPYSGLSDDEFDQQQETITSLLLQMAYHEEPPAPGAVIALSEAVKAAWAKAQSTAEIADVIEALKITRDGGAQASIQNEVVNAAANLIPRLTAFIESPSRGQFFRGPGTLDPKSRLTMFELGGLSGDPHLQKCVVFFVLNLLLTRVQSIPGRKWIFVDEVHDLFKDAAAAEVMEGIYLKCRRDKVSTWIVVQSLYKLATDSPAGAVILNMAAWKVILKQSAEEIDKVISQKIIASFQGDPYFHRLLKSVESRKNEFSEALIFGNGSYEVGRLYLDKLAATLFSSEDEARFGVFALMEQGVPAMDAVRQVLGDTKAARRAWLQSIVAQLKADEGLTSHEIVQEIREVLQ